MEVPQKTKTRGFPGGAVVENPPASVGDAGSSPGPGGSHMPRSSWAYAHGCRACTLESVNCSCWACVSQLLGPAHLEPMLRNRRGHRSERPARPR